MRIVLSKLLTIPFNKRCYIQPQRKDSLVLISAAAGIIPIIMTAFLFIMAMILANLAGPELGRRTKKIRSS